MQEIMGYKWGIISAGGQTLFCYTKGEKDGNFMVAWGQSAMYGELAFGAGAVSSSLSFGGGGRWAGESS